MSFAHASPIMYPPLDCSADSAMTSHRPKCSAGITPRISYRENARLLPQFFALAERAAMPVCCFSFSCSPSVYRRKVEPWQAEPQQSQATQSQTDERRFVPIYTTAGPRGRQQPTPESFYYSAVKRLNITRRRMLDALLGSGCLKYYLSAKRFTQSSISSGMEYLSGSKRTVLERSSDSGAGGVTPVRRAVSSMHSNSSSSFLPVSAG